MELIFLTSTLSRIEERGPYAANFLVPEARLDISIVGIV